MNFHFFQCCSNFINFCWSFFNCGWYSMIPLIFFIYQLLHVLLPWIFNPFLVYYQFAIFKTVWPHDILISFCWLVSFKLLAHSFCFFPFAIEITPFAFCLLFLYSFHVSVDFSFFPISILFLLFPYCFSNFLIPPACFLMPAWAFWQSTCDLCCICIQHRSHCSYVASVHFHSASSTISLTMLWCSWHVFSSLSFHTCTLGPNFLCCLFCCIKPHVHY